MTKTGTKFNLRTALLEMEKQKRARFALLAMVGVRKREASQLREEMLLYYTTATELAALSVELLAFLQRAEATAPQISPLVAESTFTAHRSIKRLLNFSAQNSESQQRLVTLLNSDGLETMMGVTGDGYLSLSSDQIIGNVARVIEVTKARSRKVSLLSEARRLLASAGIGGKGQAAA